MGHRQRVGPQQQRRLGPQRRRMGRSQRRMGRRPLRRIPAVTARHAIRWTRALAATALAGRRLARQVAKQLGQVFVRQGWIASAVDARRGVDRSSLHARAAVERDAFDVSDSVGR